MASNWLSDVEFKLDETAEEVDFEDIAQPPILDPGVDDPDHSVAEWADHSREGTYNDDNLKEDFAKMGFEWSDRLQSINETMEPKTPFADTPPYFVEVLEIGSGVHGTVVLCLSRPSAVAVKYDLARNRPLSIKDLKSKFVAVKVADAADIEFTDARNELKMHEILAQHTKSPYFLSLRGYSSASLHPNQRLPGNAKYWIAMDALWPPVTVNAAWNKFPGATSTIRNSLLLQVLCGVMEALRILHSHDPAIVHGDIHDENVMLRISKDLPAVVVIDFDRAKLRSDDSYEQYEGDEESEIV